MRVLFYGVSGCAREGLGISELANGDASDVVSLFDRCCLPLCCGVECRKKSQRGLSHRTLIHGSRRSPYRADLASFLLAVCPSLRLEAQAQRLEQVASELETLCTSKAY